MKSSFCIDLQRFMLIPTKFPLSPKDAIAVILQDLFTLVYPFLMNSNIMSRLPNIRLMSLRKIKSNEMLHPKRYFPIKKENAYTASGVAISTIKI